MEDQHNKAIPAEVLAAAQKKVDEIAEMLKPYLMHLTMANRREMLKMGDKTLAFVTKAFELAGQNPAICPGYLNMSAFGVDMTDATKLLVLNNSLEQLQQGINDTSMVAGSEAFQSALVFYNSAKEATSRKVSGAKAVYSELRERFPHATRKK
jgi:hypothetical protein